MTSCEAHPDLSVAARCTACDRGLCADCWQVTVDDAPACDACATILTRKVSRLVPLIAVGLALLVLIRVAWMLRAGGWYTWAGAGFGLAVAVASAWRLTAAADQRRAGRTVAARPPEAAIAAAGHPFRGGLRRAARRLAPPVSGALAVMVVAAALLVTALAIPAALRLSWWVELELIVAAWWLIWTVALGVLLHRGWRVARDP